MVKYVMLFGEYFINIFIQELISCWKEYEELCELDHVMNITEKHKLHMSQKKFFSNSLKLDFATVDKVKNSTKNPFWKFLEMWILVEILLNHYKYVNSSVFSLIYPKHWKKS